MTREQFADRVALLEPIAIANPRRYKARVAGFALVGYGFLASLVLGLLAMLVATLASFVYLKALGLKLALVVAPFLWLVLRSLVVHIPPPSGIEITRRDAPALFELIERLRRQARAPRFHRVVINDEFNAGVAQIPALGLFGWHRNHLVLGLPLLRSLAPQQFEAVLAHELGHLSGGDARFSNRLYRLRMIWSQLLDELHREGHRGGGMIRRFVDWYVPRFNAYSFPLARANEYAADAVSARVTSPQAAAEALTAVNVVGHYLRNRYWPSVFAKASDMPHPAFGPYARFSDELDGAIAGDEEDTSLQHALAQRTSPDNTHPSLTDRLRALGAEPRLALPSLEGSATQLLGDARERIVERLDRRWQDHVIHDWRKRYEQVQQSRERLESLDQRAATEPLDVDEAIERTRLTAEHGAGLDAAIEQLRALHAHQVDSALVNYELGIRLLERDDASGQSCIERAIELDEGAKRPGYEALRDFHWRRGNIEAAGEFNDRAQGAFEDDEAARKERSTLHFIERVESAQLDVLVRDALGAELARVKGVRRAWIGRKHLRVRPQPPVYVLAFSRYRVSWPWGTVSWWISALRSHEAEREQDIRARIIRDVSLPGAGFVLCVDSGGARRIGKALRSLQDSVIRLHR
jgi:Zn-dependent protease with chaperone function